MLAAFNDRLKNEYEAVLEEIKAFVKRSLDVETNGKWLVRAILEMIEADAGIKENVKFHIMPGNIPVYKSDLRVFLSDSPSHSGKASQKNLPERFLFLWRAAPPSAFPVNPEGQQCQPQRLFPFLSAATLFCLAPTIPDSLDLLLILHFSAIRYSITCVQIHSSPNKWNQFVFYSLFVF